MLSASSFGRAAIGGASAALSRSDRPHNRKQRSETSLRTSVRLSVAFLIALTCAGCASTVIPLRFVEPEPAPPPPPAEPFVSTNEPVVLARKHFERGEYGLSERYFRQAVEQNPKDADSWVGLAASYDNLKRFDLADRAYKRAFQLSGPTLPLLNDMGYSYMLRGDSRRARAAFKKALALDPTNVTVINNLRLTEGAAAPVPAPHPK